MIHVRNGHNGSATWAQHVASRNVYICVAKQPNNQSVRSAKQRINANARYIKLMDAPEITQKLLDPQAS